MTLDERIDDLVAHGTSDPYKVASEIVGSATPRELRELLEETLPVYVRFRLRVRRFPPGDAIRNLDRFRKDTHWIDGRWKAARLMEAKDCAWLGNDYSKRADGNGDWADVWYEIARLLTRRRVKTVGQLSDEDVTAALAVAAEKRERAA